MMTEDEAKKKWCPHVRLGDEQGVSASINRAWGLGNPDAACCIGSACMAWRRGREMFQLEDGRLRDPRDGFLGDIDYKHVRLGYCGLAGQP